MIIYYDEASSAWVCRGEEKKYAFGKNGSISGRNSPQAAAAFPVLLNKDRAGPLVGIAASPGKKARFKGNVEFFEDIQRTLFKKGGISFVFSPADFTGGQLEGAVFIPAENRWTTAVFPHPDVIYNRIPERWYERGAAARKLFSSLRKHRIPYFNGSFFNKWEALDALQHHPDIKEAIPDTELFDNESDWPVILERFGTIFVKPIDGSKGKGIVKVEKQGGALLVSGQNEPAFTCTEDELMRMFESRKYLVQAAVKLPLFEGSPYDFRILCHKHHDCWSVSGVGIRQAGEHAVTTHVPQGGRILNFDQIPIRPDIRQFERILPEIGETLEQLAGPLYEFSIDAGVSPEGRLAIFEANAKPMRFDEPAIRSIHFEALADLFMEFSDFKEGIDDVRKEILLQSEKVSYT
ncbi:YheC/YheD family protein [Bacillus marinisedimentorum]|uniref:YheC/YheD family endospore coat-associated protein n=1 Tax=Bacillus marinisedimentorum TaxID=1821260 RepID=UPI0007E17232|nr:YheC/YheD family protein [Bacillus marinisedimentorum]